MILYDMKVVVVASVIIRPSIEMLVPGTSIYSCKQKTVQQFWIQEMY
jgi:hypothetical protein